MNAETVPVPMFVDELRDYAVRDRSRLSAGLTVVEVCLGLPVDADSREYPFVDMLGYPFDHCVTVSELVVREIGEYSWSELHGREARTDDLCEVVLFESLDSDSESSKYARYRFLSDVGVEPYVGGDGRKTFNATNFLLDVGELERFGVEVIPRVSTEWQSYVDGWNAKASALRGDTSYWPRVFGHRR